MQTGEILFHPSRAGETFLVDYWGKGSLVESEDINALYNAIKNLDEQQKTPEFTDFYIKDQSTKYTVGESFPSSDLPITKTFIWSISHPSNLKSKSIKIINKTDGSIIANGLENTGSCDISFETTTRYTTPTEIIFEISAESNHGDILSMQFSVFYYELIFYGLSVSNTDIDIAALKSSLFSKDELFNLSFNEATEQYKFIAIPSGYKLNSCIDKETSLQIVFTDIFTKTITNSFGLDKLFDVYVTAYPIESNLSMLISIGEKS